MKPFRSLITPLVAFVGIQLAWVTVVIFWVSWVLRSHRRIRELALQYGIELPRAGIDWVLLSEGLLLLGAILAGVYVIFLFWRRQAALYREQKSFVSQVTHELKSPLASLRLYLETIRLRQPPPEKLADFVDTMLSDTERLDGLISNLLTANRLDHRPIKLSLRPGDLSAFVEGYFRERSHEIPDAGSLELAVEAGLRARFEPESLGMVLRNLLENAILYADGPPQIRVELTGEGRWCHLILADRGRGIDLRDQKKVFRMFHRVRRPGEQIQGSGLGLFIARALVLRHKGRIRLESEGVGKGTSFHILLPRFRDSVEGEPQ